MAVVRPYLAVANVLQNTLGSQFRELRTMMQYSFQSNNTRGKLYFRVNIV
ncbi:hypothetical protein MHH56_24090 [Paenibacillus sp. FSL K6-3182]